MSSHTKVVDLTMDNDDSDTDTEMLSLQERILLIEKRKNKNEDIKTVSISSSKQMYSASFEKVDVKENDDSDSEFELPDLADILGVKHSVFQSTENIVKEISPDNDIAMEIHSEKLTEVFIAPQTDILLESEEEFKVLVEAPKPKRIKSTKDKDESKEIAKQEKLKLREEKKKEKELEKALKASEKELQKSKKPDECLKNMKVLLDQSILFEQQSEEIFFALDEANIQYNIEENALNMSVIWCRTVVDVTVDDNKVVKQEREEIENCLVLVIKNENFIRMVNASTLKSKGKSNDELSLLDHISNIKVMFPSMDITAVVIGLDKYQKSIKENETCNLELKKISKQVSKAVIEEATTEVQIQAFVNFNFLNNMREFGDLLARFSKAIAEAPQRREKHLQKSLAFSWYADADSSCPVKLGKDGDGLVKLWRQQIQQFNNVGSEVAEAISTQYPTLHSLLKAYKRCSTTQEAERLLQDIVVRRNYGPLGTQRRIGPELSYKMHLFYTSRDGNQVLQR